MNEWNEQEVQKALEEIGRRSATDPEFRALALRDANAAIAAVSPFPVPEVFKVRFVENEGANLTVVLPDPANADGELSDSELEQVAGGKGSAASPSASLAGCNAAALAQGAGLQQGAGLRQAAGLR